MRKPKFRAGQIVMVNDQGSRYPVKLKKRTCIGAGDPESIQWFDTLNHVEYESRMRPLTAREIGPRPNRRAR